jgi:hypothetical protein
VRDLLKCFLVKRYPVGNSAEDLTAVDEIVAVGVDPIFVVVVNLELEVRWNPRGLIGERSMPFTTASGITSATSLMSEKI